MTGLAILLVGGLILAVRACAPPAPPPPTPGPPGSGTLVATPPARVIVAGPSGAVLGSSGPAPVVAVAPDGRRTVVHPVGVRFPVGAVVHVPTGTDSSGRPTHVLLAVEGRRAAFLPDFRRPVVGVAAFDSLGNPVRGPGRPVVASQARPLVQVGLTVRVGAQASQGRVAGYVAASPLRVWGFRPDVAVSARRDSTGGLGLGASVGASVDVLPALSVRGAWGVAGADRGLVAGLAFRF